MTDGVMGVISRMQQLNSQIRTFDPAWIGLSGDAFGTTGSATWASGTSGGTFNAALAAAGSEANAGAPAAALAAPSTASGALAWAIPASKFSPNPVLVTGSGGSISSGDVTSTTPVTAGGGVAAGTGISGGLAFEAPVKGARISLPFGPCDLAQEPATTWNGTTYAHFHQAIDYAAPEGTPVTAAADGVVTLAGRVQDGAVDVIIRHANGVETLYGHLQVNLKVHVGQRVKAGEQLGQVGMTGHTNGPHCHFRLMRGGCYIDPAPFLARGVLAGVGKGTTATDGAGTAGGVGGPDFAAFDKVASQIPYAKEIRAAAASAGIDPLLLASLVKFESDFRPNSVSHAGAMGLTQLMPETVKSLGITDPFDPAQNLLGGAKWLAGDLKLYGRADLALAAYQAGRGTVAAADGMPLSATTRRYVSGILQTWNSWLKKAAAA